MRQEKSTDSCQEPADTPLSAGEEEIAAERKPEGGANERMFPHPASAESGPG